MNLSSFPDFVGSPIRIRYTISIIGQSNAPADRGKMVENYVDVRRLRDFANGKVDFARLFERAARTRDVPFLLN